MCTMLLADMGANVIKIERPGTGDDTRRMGSRLTHDIAGGFLALNRNKRSIALDLRSDEGKAVFRRMAETADIVAENFRPGVMDRLGLGYEALAEDQPAAGVRQHIRIRRHRPVPQPGRLRPGCPGDERADVDHRLSGRAAGQGGRPHHRHRRGQLHRLRHPGGVHPRPAHGTRPAGGRVAAGGGHRLHGVGVVGVLRQRRGAGPAGVGAPGQRAVPGPAHERRLHQHRRGVATDVGAVLPRHRPGCPHRGRAVPGAQRPQGAGDGAGRTAGGHPVRAHHRPLDGAAGSRRRGGRARSTTWSRCTATSRCWPGR